MCVYVYVYLIFFVQSALGRGAGSLHISSIVDCAATSMRVQVCLSTC